MVSPITKQGKTYYICDDCKLAYKNKSIAEKCEAWCLNYKSCNLDITKHSIDR